MAASILVVPAAADAQTAVELTADNGSANGMLAPMANGNFAWYFVNTVPRKPLLLTLDVDKSKPSGGAGQMGSGIGFDVYRITDGAWVSHAGAFANDPTATSASAAVSSGSSASKMLVVVYNYTSLSPNYVFSANFAPMTGTDTDKGAPVLTPGQYAAGTIGTGASGNVLLDLQNIPWQPLAASIVLSNSTKALTFGLGDNPGQPSTQSKSNQFKVGANLWSGSKLLACAGGSQKAGGGELHYGMNATPGGPITCVSAPFVYQAPVYGTAGATKGPTDVRWMQYKVGAINPDNGDKNSIGLQVFNNASGSQDYAVTFQRVNLPVNP